jgi:hypothetical protein
MSKRSKYFYWTMLIVNLAFSAYFVSRWVAAKPVPPVLSSKIVTDNPLVRDEIASKGIATQRKYVVALMSKEATDCSDNKVANLIKATRVLQPGIPFHVLFPHQTTEQAIATFKHNLDVDFEASTMGQDLDDFWEAISRKYSTPVVVLVNNGELTIASEDLRDIRQALESSR